MTIPQGIQKQHVEAAFKRIQAEGIPRGAASTGYDVIDPVSGRSFPPKLVVSYAAEAKTGKKLSRKRFHGGDQTNTVLQDLNFKVVAKSSAGTARAIETLRPGDVLNSAELLGVFKVGNSGGMRWSSAHQCLVLFTDHTASLYDDRWVDDVLHYTGEGPTGDQQLTRQNRRLAGQRESHEDVHYFEIFETGRYNYVGRLKLAAAAYQEIQDDQFGQPRQVYVFPLQREAGQLEYAPKKGEFERIAKKRQRSLRKKSIEELMLLASQGGRERPGKRAATTSQYDRCVALVELTRRLAEGRCDLCEMAAPFVTPDGPFLECHHLIPLADKGADLLSNTIALCPNCHRKMHFVKSASDAAKLRKRIFARDRQPAWSAKRDWGIN